MVILRLPPFPLSVKYDMPSPNTEYYVYIENDAETVDASNFITTDSNNVLTLSLSQDFIKYDHDYSITIYDVVDEEPSDIVVEDILTIVRPYVDPNTLGTTATEISEYKEYEQLARAIIDSIVPGGFTFEKNVLEVVGQGTDYMPVWDRAYKVTQVYENGKLVYDVSLATPAIDGYDYLVTRDGTSIVKVLTDNTEAWNRAEKKPLQFRSAASDSNYAYEPSDSMSWEAPNYVVSFPEGVDYIFIYESGFKVIPNVVRDATIRLIEDIKCGKMDHFTRYIKEYETDQFTVTYADGKFSGTGNILVDSVLQKYITNVGQPGIL
jgi:hypothetical protein